MSERLLVGTRKGLFTIKRGPAAKWSIDRVDFLGAPVPLMLADARDPGGTLYAVIDHGHWGRKLQRTRDNGATWIEVAVPKYPARPENADDICPMRKVPIPWNLEGIWALEVADPARKGTLWCGTAPGGVFYSEDAGESWELNRALWDHPGRRAWVGGGTDWPAPHSICVDPRDSKTIRIAISCGGVWTTTDAGKSWGQTGHGLRSDYLPPDQAYNPDGQDAHRMVQCPTQPDNLWIQHHNGIFRTTDSSKSWTEIKNVKPSAFGFAVAVHPTKPDTAWFVPGIKDEQRVAANGQVCVTRTRDGGKTFEALRNGLPQEHAYDLTFRHALDIDRSGNRLAFGTTTGSLWVTENQGDTWQTVSEHLPPVYSVRFG
ncbi:MAG: hypothetical protein IT444_10130 [Phycisphaeraceae bacterium]|nr:hypothetical protein [Phycisphaeraceae bacterium]